MNNYAADPLQVIAAAWRGLLEAFFQKVIVKPGQILVLGCSTSEVLGEGIGQKSSVEVAAALLPFLREQVQRREIFLAVQGCEHINRALVVEEVCAERYGLEPVMVAPSLQAGGAMAVAAWQTFSSPLMVERIQGHAGIDIGDTFVAMHLRPVVVPVRLYAHDLGGAHITFAHTRPRYVGGPRAVYA